MQAWSPERGDFLFESSPRSSLLVAHDLFPKTGIHLSRSGSGNAKPPPGKVSACWATAEVWLQVRRDPQRPGNQETVGGACNRSNASTLILPLRSKMPASNLALAIRSIVSR